jgi:DNA polymerase I
MIAKTEAERLVLFDAHAIIHRAYHALPDFATKDGEPTGGLYGLSTMLIRSIQEFAPDYMAACYDLPGPTFRHKEYKEYKAGRAKTDDALKQQLTRSRDIFGAFHIPIYDAPGFEADDMLGTIVEQLKDHQDLEILIVTGDMDTLQLVTGKRVRVYTLKKGINDTVIYDEDKVFERFGFHPLSLPDYKGLRGDPSDNIIGIAGIGEKTGSDLIARYKSIENLYSALKKDKEAVIQQGTKARIAELLLAGEDDALFSKMLATIRRDAPILFDLPKDHWKNTFTIDKAITLFEQLEFRTLGVRVRALILDVSPDSSSQQAAMTQVEEEVIDPALLREAALALFVVASDHTTAGIEAVREYTGEKTLAGAHQKLMEELKNTGLEHVYRDIELPLFSILDRAHKHGILIDTAYLATLSREYHERQDTLEQTIHELAGETFNINSPKQLGVILFDTLGLTVKGLKKTAGGARSTRESELEKLRDQHPIISQIFEYRELQKLLSTYIDSIPTVVDGASRIHPTLHQDGAATGRFSSSNPSVQNIPVRDGLGAPIRNAFIAPEGKTLLAFDYSQIEMRVLAMHSGDPGLTDIFVNKEDIHTSVASRVFSVPPDQVTKEMRRKAKVINFGIIYGMGVTALKQNLGTTREEAQVFYDQYFVTFPRIREFFDTVIRDATQKGYTETLSGRRRYFPDLKSRLPFMRASAERMAMNAPLQGTAADIVKIAMRDVDHALENAGLAGDAVLILQVHDELIFEVTEDKKLIHTVISVVTEAMEHAHRHTSGAHIPLIAEHKIGKRWGSMDEGRNNHVGASI